MKLSEKIMSEFNQVNHSYNLHKNINFRTCNVKTVHYGTNTQSYLGLKMWNFSPPKIKDSKTLDTFRKKINHGSQIDAHAGSGKLLSYTRVLLIWISAS